MSSGQDFWSRRKAAVEAEEKATEAAETPRVATDDRDDAEILAELNLPDPDELKPGDDIAGFMSKAVPERLRRRALRKLWSLNPVLANVDGLVDYGQDFTDSAMVIENLQTTYQVGKGLLAHVEEMARQAEAEAKAEAADPTQAADGTDEAPQIETRNPVPDADADTLATDTEETPQPDVREPVGSETSTLVAPAPRRMRFEFEDPVAKLSPRTGRT